MISLLFDCLLSISLLQEFEMRQKQELAFLRPPLFYSATKYPSLFSLQYIKRKVVRLSISHPFS
jgi:hypothetical protein